MIAGSFLELENYLQVSRFSRILKVYGELGVNMSKLTNSLLVVTLLSISVEVIAEDSEYPATDFQPKVLYQDEEYEHSTSSDSAASSSSSSSEEKEKGEVSVADSDYPAANFEPEVLYKDDEYKHTENLTGSAKSESSSTGSSDSASADDQAESVEDSSMNLIIGLALLAVAGFGFYSKNLKKLGDKASKTTRKSPKAKKKRAAKKGAAKKAETAKKATVLAGSESGVAKYLEGKNGNEPSGVSKYLDERDTAFSGVSKYVAKQKITARVASVTGVEKYLKDKG